MKIHPRMSCSRSKSNQVAVPKRISSRINLTMPGVDTTVLPERLGSSFTANMPHRAANKRGSKMARTIRSPEPVREYPQIPKVTMAASSIRNLKARFACFMCL